MDIAYDDLYRLFREAAKPPAAWRIGTEAEKFGVLAESGAAIPWDGERSVSAVLSALVRSGGWKPVAEHAGGPTIALARGDESITLEPGGQLELSSAPRSDLHAVCADLEEHHAELRPVSEELGIAWLRVGFHPLARQEDLPWVPKGRYEIMRRYLPTRGAHGLDMMRRTATVQANFDYASAEDAMRKLRLSLRISPVVTAMTANAPFREGRTTGGRSLRARVWLDVDPDRTGLLPDLWDERTTLRDYVEWALDAPMFLFKREGRVVPNTGQTFRAFLADGWEGHRPTLADWEMHVNTLFPEVRLKRTIEVRGADSLPADLACGVPALWTGLLYDDRALAEAEAIAAPWTPEEMIAVRPLVAERGLAARLRGAQLADVAQRLLDIARAGLVRRARRDAATGADESVYLTVLARLVEHARCPADRLVEGYDGAVDVPADEIVRRTRA